jgi:hypothetical protein
MDSSQRRAVAWTVPSSQHMLSGRFDQRCGGTRASRRPVMEGSAWTKEKASPKRCLLPSEKRLLPLLRLARGLRESGARGGLGRLRRPAVAEHLRGGLRRLRARDLSLPTGHSQRPTFLCTGWAGSRMRRQVPKSTPGSGRVFKVGDRYAPEIHQARTILPGRSDGAATSLRLSSLQEHRQRRCALDAVPSLPEGPESAVHLWS